MKKISILVLLLVVASFNARAAFVDLGQTHRDTTTNLEWLNFSNLVGGSNQMMTMGFSINDSLSTFNAGNGGFRLATETEVSGLFANAFTYFSPTANGIMQFPGVNGASGIYTERDSWMSMFGTDALNSDAGTTITLNPDGSTTRNTTSGTLSSRGMYVDDFGNVQYAGVLLDVSAASTKIYGSSFSTGLGLNPNSAYANFGVFMVREYDVSPIPVPASVWLMMSGLIGLVAIARRKA